MRLFTGEFKKLPLQSGCTCQGPHELEDLLTPCGKLSTQCRPRLHNVSAYATHVRTGPQLAPTHGCQDLAVPARPCTTP